jgi:hypothetical protein
VGEMLLENQETNNVTEEEASIQKWSW